MSDAPVFEAVEKNGNLHIHLEGQFTSGVALELVSFLRRSRHGGGNIIINTKKVTDITLESTNVFEERIGLAGLPRKNIYLVGVKGLEICQLVHRRTEWRKRQGA